MGVPQKTGSNGERLAQSWLSRCGVKSKSTSYTCPYDLLCDGKRIEVKTGEMRTINGAPAWTFNIHRHGKLDESQVDFYILRLVDFPGMKNALHLVLPAPIGRKTIYLSMRNLLRKYSKYVNNFQAIRNGAGQVELEQ